MKPINEPTKKDMRHMSNKKANDAVHEGIESALLLLMREKPFDDITITEIIKRAKVSRISYYRNYDSKEAILDNFLERFIFRTVCVVSQFDAGTDGLDAWVLLLEMTRAAADDYKLLLDAGFGDMILRKFILGLDRANQGKDEELYMRNVYLAGCLYSILTQWILDDMKTDHHLIARICSDLMFKGLK